MIARCALHRVAGDVDCRTLGFSTRVFKIILEKAFGVDLRR